VSLVTLAWGLLLVVPAGLIGGWIEDVKAARLRERAGASR
jgi:hypothetical protein